MSECTQQTHLGNHGYRFEGDQVILNADLVFSEEDAALPANWFLQLWANRAGFASAPEGIKIAETLISPLVGSSLANLSCPAMLPAGSDAQSLALAIVGLTFDGQTIVRDWSVFPDQATFVQPALEGEIRCKVEGNGVELNVASVTNPRDIDNLSGTLSLELWVTSSPYLGGAWSGILLASTNLGTLGGGQSLSDLSFQLPASLPEGCGEITVMLREWTELGYVTRDYRTLQIAQAPAVTAEPAKKAAPKAGSKAAPKAKAKVEAKVEAKEKAPVKEAAKEAAPAPAKAKKAAAAEDSGKVSINKASLEALTAVKGLSAKVAEGIVAGRPFASLDDLARVKGLSKTILAKVRSQLTCP